MMIEPREEDGPGTGVGGLALALAFPNRTPMSLSVLEAWVNSKSLVMQIDTRNDTILS